MESSYIGSMEGSVEGTRPPTPLYQPPQPQPPQPQPQPQPPQPQQQLPQQQLPQPAPPQPAPLQPPPQQPQQPPQYFPLRPPPLTPGSMEGNFISSMEDSVDGNPSPKSAFSTEGELSPK